MNFSNTHAFLIRLIWPLLAPVSRFFALGYTYPDFPPNGRLLGNKLCDLPAKIISLFAQK